MNLPAYFDDPHNSFGHWLAKPWRRHWLLAAAIGLCLNLYPFWQWQTLSAKSWQTAKQLAQKQAEAAHQQNLLASLARLGPAALNPRQSARLATINQQIQQQLAQSGNLLQHAQWQFGARPIVSLQLSGHFQNLSRFLTALSAELPDLALLSLQIQQTAADTNHSIDSEIRLQFIPREEE